MPEGITNQGIGASVRRKEDKKFITGSGAIQMTLTAQARFMPILCDLISPMLKSLISTPRRR